MNRTRLTVVYCSLVVVPVLASIIFLRASWHDDAAPEGAEAPGGSIARLLLAIVVIVGVAKPAGLLARRLGQPPVVGEIAAGILLGPSALGALWPAASRWLIPAGVVPQLSALAQIGVVLFVFLTGLRLDVRALHGQRGQAVVVSHVSIAFPFLLGVALAWVAHSRFAPPDVGFVPFALFLGVSMSVTALPVLSRILMDTGMFGTPVGSLALTCAVVDDVTAWVLLALVVALVTASSTTGVLVMIALGAAFVALLWFAVRPALRHRRGSGVAAGLVGLLVCALATEWIGLHAILGAFMFGVVFPSGTAWARKLETTLEGLTATLLLPLFFAFSGLHTQIGLIGPDPVLWLWCAVVLAVALAGKFAGSTVAARAVGKPWRESVQIGALMNCRGLTELIVLDIGRDLGVLSPELFTMLVVMALVSTAMAAPVVTRLRTPGRRDVSPSGAEPARSRE